VYRLKLIIVLSFFGAAALWAQEAETESDATEPAAEETAATETDEADEVTDEPTKSLTKRSMNCSGSMRTIPTSRTMNSISPRKCASNSPPTFPSIFDRQNY
jgi:hypothetical protein